MITEAWASSMGLSPVLVSGDGSNVVYSVVISENGFEMGERPPCRVYPAFCSPEELSKIDPLTEFIVFNKSPYPIQVADTADLENRVNLYPGEKVIYGYSLAPDITPDEFFANFVVVAFGVGSGVITVINSSSGDGQPINNDDWAYEKVFTGFTKHIYTYTVPEVISAD